MFPASQTPHGRKLSNFEAFNNYSVRQTSQDYQTPNQRISNLKRDEKNDMNLTQVQMNIEKIKNLKDVHQLRVETILKEANLANQSRKIKNY